MIVFTPSRGLPLIILLLLASCRSEQAAFHRSAHQGQSTASATKPEAAPENNKVAATAATWLRPQPAALPAAVPMRVRRATKALVRQQVVTIARQLQKQRLTAHTNSAARRQVREEGESRPWLIALSVALVVAGIGAGFAIGGGIGFFIGLPIALLGYYFFMKGLLGPNAWIEVGNELFQL